MLHEATVVSFAESVLFESTECVVDRTLNSFLTIVSPVSDTLLYVTTPGSENRFLWKKWTWKSRLNLLKL